MPAGFAVSIVLGRLGWAGPGLFWTLSLWIPLVCLVVGLLARVADRLFTGRHTATRPAACSRDGTPVRGGRVEPALRQARPSTATRMGAIARPGPFPRRVWLVLALSLVIIVPVTFLSVAGFVGSFWPRSARRLWAAAGPDHFGRRAAAVSPADRPEYFRGLAARRCSHDLRGPERDPVAGTGPKAGARVRG